MNRTEMRNILLADSALIDVTAVYYLKEEPK